MADTKLTTTLVQFKLSHRDPLTYYPTFNLPYDIVYYFT